MAVVSAAGQVYTPLVVLPGKIAKYRKRSNDKFETPSDLLPKPNYLYMREIAGVDSNIFFSWAENFVEETSYLRRRGEKLLLIMDGYACHITYQTLSLLEKNGIVVAGLPAHTSHDLQPLDVSVFGPLKEEFRKLLSMRTITMVKEVRNDIFTICELLCKAYHSTVTANNSIAVFRKTGIWSDENQGVDMYMIKSTEYTSSKISTQVLSSLSTTRSVTSVTENSNNPQERIHNAQQLYSLFLHRSSKLVSDGPIVENGTISVSTTTGATLTSRNVLDALKFREQRRHTQQEQRALAQEHWQQRAIQRELQQTEAQQRRSEREKRAVEKEEAELQRLRMHRDPRRNVLNKSRHLRRQGAKALACHFTTKCLNVKRSNFN